MPVVNFMVGSVLNIKANIGAPVMNVSMNVPTATMHVNAPVMHVNMTAPPPPVMNVKMSTPHLNM